MSTINQVPIMVIAGPTAVGKTTLSIELAKKYHGEIINADSLQVYRGLNIGTGKVTVDEMQGIPHHLLDIIDVSQQFDASQFKQLIQEKIIEINQRGAVPIIVGGTGLYLEGFLYDLEFGGNQSSDIMVRQKYQSLLDEIGPKALWDKLSELDPVATESIPFQNSRRVIRALEMMEVTGQLFSSQKGHQEKKSVYNHLLFVMNRPREILYERINHRVEMMVEHGLEEEARWLYDQKLSMNLTSVKGIGYKEWWPYFQGEIDKSQVIESIKQNSRRYAKRQITWFKNRMGQVYWIDTPESEETQENIQTLIEQHLSTGGELFD